MRTPRHPGRSGSPTRAHGRQPPCRSRCRGIAGLELAAGCVYDGSDYPNAFQWIELYPVPRRVRVHFRLWVKGKWQWDRNQPGGDAQGVAEFRLPPRADPAALQAAPAAPTIPAGYLAWLRRTYGGADLLGQDAQQGQSVTLSQVYCPAVTVPATPPTPTARPADAEQQPPTLLLPRPNGRAAFYHLSFQEFLAAERISCTADRAALELVFRNRWTVPAEQALEYVIVLGVEQVAHHHGSGVMALRGGRTTLT